MRVNLCLLSCFFFFFQAEDGIRDYKVTGVQTCALPIFEVLGHRRDRTGVRTEGDPLRKRAISLAEEHADVVPFAVDDEQVQMAIDRKSTRLNSSHLVISYAVFCLKKKKNKHNCSIEHYETDT